MKIRAFIFLLFLSLPLASAGQEGFAFKRKIEGGKEGWAKIVLPDEIYKRVRTDLGDIRIFGVMPNGDSIEAPYVPDSRIESGVKRVEFRIINRTRTSEGRYYTFETAGDEYVNRIDLSFGTDNFDWRISLEGSNDGQNWQTIVDGYRIVGIRNNLTTYRFTRLEFPQAKFEYFRLFVPAVSDPGPVSASLDLVAPARRDRTAFPVNRLDVREDKKAKRTVLDITLPLKVPVSAVRIEVADKIDYFRPAVISYPEGESGKDRYVRHGSFVLSSFESGPYTFDEAISDRFRITVENKDSAPLRYTAVEPLGYRYSLTARLPEASEYWLFYSDPDASRPVYDIERFTDRIPEDLSVLETGTEQPASEPAAAILYLESRAWLWAVLTIVILLLGWFSYRLLRKAG